MIVKKPSIFIYVNQPCQEFVREVCAGIEEEGVFSEVFEREDTDPDFLAFEAARDSMMGSGIGIYGETVVLQMKGLPMGRNLESCYRPSRQQCRNIGANSARAIKKQAFK